VTDLEGLADRLESAADRVGDEVDRTVQQQARLARALIREHASGRPGPNIITGQYVASWRIQSFPVPDGGGAIIGTHAPQGRRLEFGFFDMTDSIGRHFWQVPRPHVGPSVNELSGEMESAFKDACARIFRS